MKSKRIVAFMLSVLMLLAFLPSVVSAEDIETTTAASFLAEYDLNHDNVVNGFDLALMKQKLINNEGGSLCELVSLKRFLINGEPTQHKLIDVSEDSANNVDIIANICNENPIRIDIENAELVFEHETLRFFGIMNIANNNIIAQGKCSDGKLIQTYKVFNYNNKLFLDVEAIPVRAAEAIYLENLEVSEKNTKRLIDIFSSQYEGATNSGDRELTLSFTGLNETSIIADAEPDIPTSAVAIYELHINEESRVVITLYQCDTGYLIDYRM